MRKNKKLKLMVPSMLIITLLLFITFGTSYAFYKYVKTGDFSNAFTTGSIIFNYTEDSSTINLTNAYPEEDAVGKVSQSYFDFSISSSIKGKTIVNYEIYLTPNVNNNIPLNYIKVYLTNENNNPLMGFESDIIPTYANLSAASSDANGKRLFLGTISSQNNISMSEHFRLRIWIADDFTNNSVENVFSVTVNVKAYN